MATSNVKAALRLQELEQTRREAQQALNLLRARQELTRANAELNLKSPYLKKDMNTGAKVAMGLVGLGAVAGLGYLIYTMSTGDELPEVEAMDKHKKNRRTSRTRGGGVVVWNGCNNNSKPVHLSEGYYSLSNLVAMGWSGTKNAVRVTVPNGYILTLKGSSNPEATGNQQVHTVVGTAKNQCVRLPWAPLSMAVHRGKINSNGRYVR
jgi:hypothetical protein